MKVVWETCQPYLACHEGASEKISAFSNTIAYPRYAFIGFDSTGTTQNQSIYSSKVTGFIQYREADYSQSNNR